MTKMSRQKFRGEGGEGGSSNYEPGKLSGSKILSSSWSESSTGFIRLDDLPMMCQEALHNKFVLKGCVHYLNRCTTSPTYILHQLNEKNELTITYDICFYHKHCHFWKRHLPAILIISTSHVFIKFRIGNQGNSAFKLCDLLASPNESCFKNEHNKLSEIEDQVKNKSCFKNEHNKLGEIDDQIKESDWL